MLACIDNRTRSKDLISDRLEREMDHMKHLGEFLDNAVKFERMAEEATDPVLKGAMEEQARAYRRMAAKRAEQLGMPAPSSPGN
jgi:hypothetical protein